MKNSKIENLSEIESLIENLSILPNGLTISEDDRYRLDNRRINIQNRLYKQIQRKVWNKYLRRMVLIGFIFNIAIIILVGCEVLKFDQPYAIPSLVGNGLAQTFGLAYLAVKYFFNEDVESDKNLNKN